MSRLLYVEGSPRKQRSRSIKVAKCFLEEYERYHPSDEISIMDLWGLDLPEINGNVLDAKYNILHGRESTQEQKKSWKSVEDVISLFLQGDKLLFSLPMWNFGIPYRLKHFFDVIVQPGYTFSFSAERGYEGLLSSRKACMIFARGGEYSSEEASAYDIQKRYMYNILGFMGITELSSIIVEPTLQASQEELEKVMRTAEDQARRISKDF